MATRTTSSNPTDEIFFQNEGVSLCLLVNRRARAVRVIDFRSGPNPAKRIFVLSLARREGVERIVTLVERDEVSTWSRLGFQREGTIPGFYKRSDAWVLGTTVGEDTSEQSGMRPAASNTVRVDRAYHEARRIAKERSARALPHVRLQVARDPDVKKALSQALRSGRALSGFETFGRDVERTHFACTSRGGFSLIASVESQACFNNAFLELLTGPRTEKEALLTASALRLLCDELFERGVVCCFALSPVSNTDLGAAYCMNGFRRTGLMSQHLLIGGRRADAFVWSRKLAQPTDT